MHLWEAFRQGLHELGYVEGQNIALEFPAVEVQPERLPDLAAALVRLQVDAIVAAMEPAILAATAATTTIPIIMPVANNPVETGIVASLARPGGNVTGLSLISTELSGKRLQLLKELVPGASRIAVLSYPALPTDAPQLRETEVAAQALGVTLQRLDVRGLDDLATALQAATQRRADALVVLDHAFFFTHRARIVAFAAQSGLPAIYTLREFVKDGGLLSYAPNLADMYRRAATYVDRILRGAKPADLPVQQPTKFELVINLKVAKALGLTIPPTFLFQADEVIQ
jgi:putative ABC transport system substrate-binding protein